MSRLLYHHLPTYLPIYLPTFIGVQQVRVGEAGDGVVHYEQHSVASGEGAEVSEVGTRQQGVARELGEDGHHSVHHRRRGSRKGRG